MKNALVLVLCIVCALSKIHAQTCTSNPVTIGASINFSALNWTSTGGAICPPSGNFTGNVVIDIGGGVNVTMNNSITISGNFVITNNGNSTMTIPSGVNVRVNGNMGDNDNNNVAYVVNGTLRVDGTLYGKNNNAFTGSGSITGGTLNVKNGTTCGSPCPVSGGFTGCTSGDGFCTTNNVVLPIILLDFNTVSTGESIQLSWTTIMEENFREFVVQRSSQGMEFEDLGSIPGAGKNIYDIRSHYSFEDKAPFVGLNYYRLKAIDLDDSYEYFKIVTESFAGGKEVTVYPNPSRGESISFRTNFNPTDEDRIVLTNQLGVEITNASATKVGNTISFDSQLYSGVYMLKYISKGFHQTVKVVVKN